MTKVKRMRWTRPLLAPLLAVVLLAALACSDGPDVDFSRDVLGTGAEAPFQREANEPLPTPLFEILNESPSVETVQSSAENSSTVACDLRVHPTLDQSQGDAYWANFPPQRDGQDLSGYRFAWLIPGDDGLTEIDGDLGAEHQGTSLIDKAIAPGLTLAFSLQPLYGGVGSEPVRVDCTRVEQ